MYPESSKESIILPLFKNGNKNGPNSYRGISLCHTNSKIYSSIINNRLPEWIEQNNLTGECQAGFKKDCSTVDHMFTVMAMIQKQFVLNRKLHVAFIDFEKAFDSISRKLLWLILLKNGIKGRLYKGLRSMYENVKARIRCGAKFTDYIYILCKTDTHEGAQTAFESICYWIWNKGGKLTGWLMLVKH